MGRYGGDRQKITIPLLEVPVPGRICWECAHLYYSEGSHGYSEYTPGTDMHLSCGLVVGHKYYWEYDQFDDSLGQLRKKLTSAERCADFKKREGEDV